MSIFLLLEEQVQEALFNLVLVSTPRATYLVIAALHGVRGAQKLPAPYAGTATSFLAAQAMAGFLAPPVRIPTFLADRQDDSVLFGHAHEGAVDGSANQLEAFLLPVSLRTENRVMDHEILRAECSNDLAVSVTDYRLVTNVHAGCEVELLGHAVTSTTRELAKQH